MANYYTRGTGVLVLKKITPVILALFSNLELEHEGSEEGSEV